MMADAPLRFLVVDDSAAMRQLITFALRRLGQVEIIEATDGVDALKKLPSGRFDLVITDINMPIMDGLKLVKLIKTNPTYKEVPVIIITTEGAVEDRERGLSLGATAYIAKPIQTTNLLETVKGILGGR
jgi:two-component system chemotaxis response regulator CheY